jgi:intein-encoded DNA endonuclease-like protein
MRPRVEREAALFLAGEGFNPCQIARWTRIPRSTIREWLRPRYKPKGPRRGRTDVDLRSLPEPEYSYILGFYLGDGCLSLGRRDVYRLRIKTDARYPGIVAECAQAMKTLMPGNGVNIQKMRYRAVEIGCSSKAWPLLFPQHGPGRKHERKIELEPWQQEIVERFPREFLRGLIHSDGCRVLNRVNGKDYSRYFFSQVSDDIRRLFCDACDRLRIVYSWNNWKTVSVARRESVALLDSFVGPKA